MGSRSMLNKGSGGASTRDPSAKQCSAPRAHHYIHHSKNIMQQLTIECHVLGGDGYNVLMLVEGRELSAAAPNEHNCYICNNLQQTARASKRGAAATATKKDATAPSKGNQFIKANADTTPN